METMDFTTRRRAMMPAIIWSVCVSYCDWGLGCAVFGYFRHSRFHAIKPGCDNTERGSSKPRPCRKLRRLARQKSPCGGTGETSGRKGNVRSVEHRLCVVRKQRDRWAVARFERELIHGRQREEIERFWLSFGEADT